jgi:TolA-binding protein
MGALLPLAAALILLLGGCAPQLNRIETGVQQNRDEIARLQAENKRLQTEVKALNELLRMDRDAGDESQAMRLAKLSQVSQRLDQLLQKLDDNAQYMRDLSARVDLLATRQGIPTLGEYKPPVAPSAAASDLPEEGRSILEAAELDRTRGNTDLARMGYEEFLQRYGNSEAADDALFRLGDLDYGEGNWDGALARFQDLLQRFPESDWTAATLFKARNCLLELGRKDEAWDLGGELMMRFPESDEAALLKAEADAPRQD